MKKMKEEEEMGPSELREIKGEDEVVYFRDSERD